MKFTIFQPTFLIMILIGSLLLFGCAPQQQIQAPPIVQLPAVQEPITLGSILILSGAGASWGTAAQNGIDMAVEKINAQGGINGRMLKVNHQDDQSDPKKAISAFRSLVDINGIDIIIGTTWSHTGIPLIEMAKENNILMVSPSLGKAEFNEASPYLFNTWPHDYILSEKLADYVIEKGHTKVGLIGAEQLWVKEQTNAFKKRFEELGGTVEVLLEPLPDTTDVSSEALKLKTNKDITALVSTTNGIVVGAKIAKRVEEIGVDLPLYSITIDRATIAAAQGSYEGMEFLTFLNPVANFEQEYEQKFGTIIEIGAPSAYDAVMLLAQAMRQTGSTDTTSLQQYLNDIKEYDGASGKLISDGKGGFLKEHSVMKVVDGEPVNMAS